MTRPRDSIAPASAAHHGQGAPSDRRLPTEASAGEHDTEPWPGAAAPGSEGAEGEPRARGEGAELPGARSGAALQDGRASGHSPLVPGGITRRAQEKFVLRQAWITTLDEPTREHRKAKAKRLRETGRKKRARLRNAGASELEVTAASKWHEDRAVGQEERISRVLDCGSTVLLITCQECNAQHERGQGCGASRFCMACRAVKVAELRGKFLAAREDVVREAKAAGLLIPERRGGPYRDKFLTLTVPHLTNDTVASRIERVLAAWGVFRRLLKEWFNARDIKRVEWLRVLEWTLGKFDQLGNPHIHVWLFAPYLARPMLKELWGRGMLAAGCSPRACERPILDIRQMTDPRSGAAELIKYLTKDIVANGEHIDPKLYAQVINALDNHRQTQSSSGFMSRAAKAPRLCEQCYSPLPKLVRRKPGAEQ